MPGLTFPAFSNVCSIFGCSNWEAGIESTTGIQWAASRNAAELPLTHRAVLHNKLPSLNAKMFSNSNCLSILIIPILQITKQSIFFYLIKGCHLKILLVFKFLLNFFFSSLQHCFYVWVCFLATRQVASQLPARDQTCISCIGRQSLNSQTTREISKNLLVISFIKHFNCWCHETQDILSKYSHLFRIGVYF